MKQYSDKKPALKLYWGIAPLIILLIGVSAVYLMRNRDTEPIVIYEVPTERETSKRTYLKKPPPGETYGTGHWDGDSWHRTAPPEPQKVSVEDEMLTYEELEDKIRNRRWEGRTTRQFYDIYAPLIIAEFPYSELALDVRYSIAHRGYQGTNDALQLTLKKEMLKYHPDSPRLLADLLRLMDEDSPEEAIQYGKAALKYVDLYASDSLYGLHTYPEDIHYRLGYAYQRVGDYKSALFHMKATQKLMEANPGRSDRPRHSLVVGHIKAMEEGSPVYGPLPPGLEDIEVPDIPFPEDFDFESDPPSDLPPEVDAAVADIFDPWDPPDEPVPSEQVDASVVRQRERDRLEFDEFLRWMEEIENVQSPAELEDFLMREMAKNLVGGNTAFSPDRLIRAFETQHRHGEEIGLRELQKMDPELGREIGRYRRKPPQRNKGERE